jgi:release factor glutamine methyltransferase
LKPQIAYRELAQAFRHAGLGTPELDARILLAFVTREDPAQIFVSEKELTQQQSEQLRIVRARRLAHESVARIIGKRAFWAFDFELSHATLEPRPDSETIIEAVLEHLGTRCSESFNSIDLGTGSGALLLSLLHECPQAFGVGVDLSFEALATAQKNAKANALDSRARFICANWLAACNGTFDVIIANPPYIPSAECESLEKDVRLYDPLLALDGGKDGLNAYRALAAQGLPFLDAKGIFVLEVGYNQAKEVISLFTDCGYRLLGVKADLAGHARVVVFAHQPS